jgi:hypothetical protein
LSEPAGAPEVGVAGVKAFVIVSVPAAADWVEVVRGWQQRFQLEPSVFLAQVFASPYFSNALFNNRHIKQKNAINSVG